MQAPCCAEVQHPDGHAAPQCAHKRLCAQQRLCAEPQSAVEKHSSVNGSIADSGIISHPHVAQDDPSVHHPLAAFLFLITCIVQIVFICAAQRLITFLQEARWCRRRQRALHPRVHLATTEWQLHTLLCVGLSIKGSAVACVAFVLVWLQAGEQLAVLDDVIWQLLGGKEVDLAIFFASDAQLVICITHLVDRHLSQSNMSLCVQVAGRVRTQGSRSVPLPLAVQVLGQLHLVTNKLVTLGL